MFCLLSSHSASKSLMVNLLQTALIPWIYVHNLLRLWQKRLIRLHLITLQTCQHSPVNSWHIYWWVPSKNIIKNNGPVISSETSLMKHFKQLDEPIVQDFIKHSSRPHCETAFLNFFTYFSSNNPTKRLHPPFINSFASLVEDPSNSIYKESNPNTGQTGGNYQHTHYIMSKQNIFHDQSLQLPLCGMQECQSQRSQIMGSQITPELHLTVLH